MGTALTMPTKLSDPSKIASPAEIDPGESFKPVVPPDDMVIFPVPGIISVHVVTSVKSPEALETFVRKIPKQKH